MHILIPEIYDQSSQCIETPTMGFTTILYKNDVENPWQLIDPIDIQNFSKTWWGPWKPQKAFLGDVCKKGPP